jgi:hypothetical protein
MNTTGNNKIIAEFMGSVRIEKDHTEYNEDGTIKFTPHKNGNKWLIEEWSKPSFFDDVFLKNYGWISYTCDNSMLYHSDWNWLMEVVDKIESLDSEIPTLSIQITNNHISIAVNATPLYTDIRQFSKISKIQTVYNACVEFIKWYNGQK